MKSLTEKHSLFKNQFNTNLKKDIHNHKYILTLIIITVATFGFTLCNFSLGMDDFGFRYYMNLSSDSYGNMIQQGRLLHLLVYYITGLADVVPFLNNFLSVILMFFSGVTVTCLIDTVANSNLAFKEKAIFFGLFISYPAIAFKFIYDLDVLVISLSYLAATLSVVYTLSFIEHKNIKDGIISTVLIIIAVSSYETFISYFGCLIILSLIIESIHTNINFKQTFSKGFMSVGVLAVSVIIYYLLVLFIQLITKNPSYPRLNLFTQDVPVYLALLGILGKAINPWVFFSLEFLVTIFIYVAFAFYYAKKTGKKYLHLLFLLFFLCLFSVNIIQGALYYRSCQTFCLFISGTALLSMIAFRNNKLSRKIVLVLLTLLLLLQIKDTNTWFYKDWMNHQKNTYAVHRIATDLHSGYDIKNKPICFVNRDYESHLMSWEPERYQHEIGESPIVASVWFLGDKTSEATFQLLEYNGYEDLLRPTEEQAITAKKLSKDMPAYPYDGYIEETDDFIIVNLGENK